MDEHDQQVTTEYRDEAISSREAMHAEVSALRGEVAALTTSIQGLVEAWKTAGTMVGVVRNVSKFITAVAAAVAVVMISIKSLGHH